MHYIDASVADHPYPLWRLVNPHEEALRGDTHNDSVWTCLQPDKETWLCNHCSDYPSPGPSSFGRIMKSRWEVSWHVQMEYVRFLVVVLFEGLRSYFWHPGTISKTQRLTGIYSHIRCLCNISVGTYEQAKVGDEGSFLCIYSCWKTCIIVFVCLGS